MDIKKTITTQDQTNIRPNKFGSTHVDVVVIMTAVIIILSLDMPLIICSIPMHATSTVAGAHNYGFQMLLFTGKKRILYSWHTQ